MVKQRAGSLLRVIRDAAPTDPDIGALWSRIESDFYDVQRPIVEALETKNALRPGLDITRATAILWTLNHPDLWHLLVGERDWTPEEWEQWFGDTTCSQLLTPRPSQKPRKTRAGLEAAEEPEDD